MSKIILTCDDGCTKQRFTVDVNEGTGDAQIVPDGAPLLERDSSTVLAVREDKGSYYKLLASVVMSVEVAP